jgi:AcrR family transcriptional regulator
MPKLLSKWFPKSRKRIKPGLQDGKRWRIYEAGWIALNDVDHEDVSIVHVAKTAGVSVGAFYRRFSDKASFLDFTVDNRLNQASERTAKALETHRWRRASNAKVVAAIVEHLVVAMHGDMRGAIRTAFRRRRPGHDEHCPLRNYQAVVADASAALLMERLGGGRRREDDIRAATQIVLATVMGSLLEDPGPLKMQRQRTIDVLTQVMAAQVGLDRSRGKDEDQPYPDASIELPPVKAEAADPAHLTRALAKKKTARTQSPAPPIGKKPPKAALAKDVPKRVHFI